MTRSKFIAVPALIAGLVLGAGAASANDTPEGVWIDHTGRGAVEIKDCGGGLCGRIVWVKNPKHLNTCRNQILGNVRPVSAGVWDRGWIVDPDDNSRYSVELKLIGKDRLRVTGYLGTKLFSETMTWKRAPADLKRCDVEQTVTAPPRPAQPTQQAAVPPPASPAPAPNPEPQVKPQEAPAGTPPAEVSVPPPSPPPAQTAEEKQPVPQNDEAAPRVATGPKVPNLDLGDLIRVKPIRGKRDGNRMCRLEVPYFSIDVPCDL